MSFAFCTEPVFASLSNIFGEDNNSQEGSKYEDLKLEDIEIRHGMFQVRLNIILIISIHRTPVSVG